MGHDGTVIRKLAGVHEYDGIGPGRSREALHQPGTSNQAHDGPVRLNDAGGRTGMANPHFANIGDVWKHLLLTEVISWLRPQHYIETHAGSAINRLVNDVERGFGARMFLSASSEVEPLRSSPYRRQILELARGAEPSYPGSPLLAMMLLGR